MASCAWPTIEAVALSNLAPPNMLASRASVYAGPVAVPSVRGIAFGIGDAAVGLIIYVAFDITKILPTLANRRQFRRRL
jgi:hypothetical protein